MISDCGSRKYILQFTLPSGQRMAATGIEGKFALTPIFENKVKGLILVWDTPAEVHQFVKELRKTAPPEEFEKLWKMHPDVVSIVMTQ